LSDRQDKYTSCPHQSNNDRANRRTYRSADKKGGD